MAALPKPSPLAPLPAHADQHDHHSHDHRGHDHHGHTHIATAPERAAASRVTPRFSLIALSAVQRLLLILPVVGVLWLLTLWAISNG